MVIKKFIAKSLPEALTKVKRDFGDDAVILKTRFDNKSAAGRDSKVVEVTAAVDNGSRSRPAVTAAIPSGIEEKNHGEIKPGGSIKIVKSAEPESKTATSEQAPANRIAEAKSKSQSKEKTRNKDILKDLESKPLPSELLTGIKDEISQMKGELNRIAELSDASGFDNKITDRITEQIKQGLSSFNFRNEQSVFAMPNPAVLEFVRLLVGLHVPEDTAVKIAAKIPVTALNGNDKGLSSLIEIITEILGQGEPVTLAENGPTVIMLVGPTGSGKSSAAARLAFKYSLEENYPVSLISTDTFRADSRAQLSSLANVIGCPFKSVSSPQELAVHVKAIGSGLVIIDTSGVSCPDDMREIASLVSAANPNEVHLVVPADISTRDLSDFVQDYPEVGIDKVFVTKLDQTNYRGGIFGAAARLELTFSYESSSRELPGKFGIFNPTAFASGVEDNKEKALSVGE